jgi:uncharacterized protein (DUF433 family)
VDDILETFWLGGRKHATATQKRFEERYRLMAAVVSTLIELDERDVAWITGTKVKVIEVATDKLAHGSSPEEMHVQYPHLSLAQIYAALAYYYEHQAEFEAEILRQAERATAWAEAAKGSPLRQRLKEQGLLPQARETI